MARKCNLFELKTIILPCLQQDLKEAKQMYDTATQDAVKEELMIRIQATENEINFVKYRIYTLQYPETKVA